MSITRIGICVTLCVAAVSCVGPKSDTNVAVANLLANTNNTRVARNPAELSSLALRLKAVRITDTEDVWKELLHVGLKKTNTPPTTFSADAVAKNSSQGALHAALRESTLINKLIDANVQAVLSVRSKMNGEPAHPVKAIEFTQEDFRQFIKTTVPRVGVASLMDAGQTERYTMADASQSGGRLKQYLIVYYKGAFVDHAGRKVSKPEMKEGKIGNETITGLATVILEAVYDSLISVPAFYEKSGDKYVWLNKGKAMPTFVLLTVNAAGDPDSRVAKQLEATTGITKPELEAISFLSDLASEESKTVSGMVFRLFGGGELSFVIGGHLSIGNNKTLAEVVDTFFELSTYRTTEALAYAYFKVHEETDYGNLEELMKVITFVLKQVENASKKSN